ncbi:MAG: hypothetical protein ACKPKO_32500, partial [Candidatus Fonsibacter sp.]
ASEAHPEQRGMGGETQRRALCVREHLATQCWPVFQYSHWTLEEAPIKWLLTAAGDLNKVLATTSVRGPALRESQIAALAGNGMAVQSVGTALVFILCATRPVLPKQSEPLGVMPNTGPDGLVQQVVE